MQPAAGGRLRFVKAGPYSGGRRQRAPAPVSFLKGASKGALAEIHEPVALTRWDPQAGGSIGFVSGFAAGGVFGGGHDSCGYI